MSESLIVRRVLSQAKTIDHGLLTSLRHGHTTPRTPTKSTILSHFIHSLRSLVHTLDGSVTWCEGLSSYWQIFKLILIPLRDYAILAHLILYQFRGILAEIQLTVLS